MSGRIGHRSAPGGIISVIISPGSSPSQNDIIDFKDMEYNTHTFSKYAGKYR